MKIDPSPMRYPELRKLLSSMIVPRPIALVSTVGPDGVFNLAPFSFFNLVCFRPPIVIISVGLRGREEKDTYRNIVHTGDFVVNLIDEAIAEQSNETSAAFPPDVDEFVVAGLTPLASDCVRSPRVAESPISLECKVEKIVEVGKLPRGSNLVIGEAAMIHIRDGLCVDGEIPMELWRPVGHLAREIYCRPTAEVFYMKRPEEYEPAQLEESSRPLR